MRKLSFLMVLLFLFSCDEEKLEPEMTISELNYPVGMGTSGDPETSVVGYGFDATGLCDTTSVKAKIANFPENGLSYGRSLSSGSNIKSHTSLFELQNKFELHTNITERGMVADISHIGALLELADNINENLSVVHYEAYYKYRYVRGYMSDANFTNSFKEDIVNLTPEQLVSKYGTHILIRSYLGTKFEIVYTCETNENTREYDLKQQFLKRLGQILGGTPYNIAAKYKIESSYWNEKMVYNTLGSKTKQFGVVEITDNNPNNIKIDYNSVFGDNMDYQFIDMAADGIISLDQLISDPEKKQEVKSYLEEYIISNSVLITHQETN